MGQPLAIPAYRLENGAEHRIFIFGDGVSIMSIDGWESDARFLFGVVDADGRPSRVILVQATIARYRGETLHDSSERLSHIVWRRDASLSGSSEQQRLS